MASIPPRCTRGKSVSNRLEHTGRINSRVSIEMTILSPPTDQLGDILSALTFYRETSQLITVLQRLVRLLSRIRRHRGFCYRFPLSRMLSTTAPSAPTQKPDLCSVHVPLVSAMSLKRRQSLRDPWASLLLYHLWCNTYDRCSRLIFECFATYNA
jgi:hypothetical protein